MNIIPFARNSAPQSPELSQGSPESGRILMIGAATLGAHHSFARSAPAAIAQAGLSPDVFGVANTAADQQATPSDIPEISSVVPLSRQMITGEPVTHVTPLPSTETATVTPPPLAEAA